MVGRDSRARDAAVRTIVRSCIAEIKLRYSMYECSCRSNFEMGNFVSGDPKVLY